MKEKANIVKENRVDKSASRDDRTTSLERIEALKNKLSKVRDIS